MPHETDHQEVYAIVLVLLLESLVEPGVANDDNREHNRANLIKDEFQPFKPRP